jgi:hypothetical protein
LSSHQLESLLDDKEATLQDYSVKMNQLEHQVSELSGKELLLNDLKDQMTEFEFMAEKLRKAESLAESYKRKYDELGDSKSHVKVFSTVEIHHRIYKKPLTSKNPKLWS